MAADHFADAAARRQLQASGFSDFDALWALPATWHEEPNQRRGGWSGVSRHVLADGTAVFVKRQENHLCRTPRHFLRGVPTCYREYRNIRRLQHCGVAAVEALYYGDRRLPGKWQAVLVTRALDDFLSLDEWNAGDPAGESSQRGSVIAAIAHACARLHHQRLQHSCLYGKHVFVRRLQPGACYQESDVRFIDLEKLRRGISRERVAGHDIDQLMRHSEGWKAEDRRAFLVAYQERRRALRDSR